ncbi:purine permease [Georgenia satyanarayanai]|nr:purine permease [Georgenia satyanarayanai]
MARTTRANSERASATGTDDRAAVDERLPLGKTSILGFQHVLVMYAGVVVVPILIGHALGLTDRQIAALVSIDLVLAGIGTVLQALGVWKFGIRMPLVVGAASQGIVPVVMVGESRGIGTVLGSVLVAGVLWLLLAPFFGTLVRFFPHVVTGTVILLIGLTLVPVGFRMIAGSDPTAEGYGDLDKLALAGFTLLLMAVFYRTLKGFLGQLSILLAIVLATAVGWVIDPSTLVSNVGQAPLVGFTAPFEFGSFVFHVPSIIIFLIIILVITVEASGQGLAVGEVTGVKVTPQDITRLLRVDALATTLSSFFFGFIYTTFGQNIGLLKLTGVRSRFPVVAGGIILIMLGIFQPVGEVMASIPSPVVGAAAAVTFGVLILAGMQILAKVDLDKPGNTLIVMFGVVFGLVPVAAPHFYSQMPDSMNAILHSGVAMGTFVAVVLNLLFSRHTKEATGFESSTGDDTPSADSADTARTPTSVHTGQDPRT